MSTTVGPRGHVFVQRVLFTALVLVSALAPASAWAQPASAPPSSAQQTSPHPGLASPPKVLSTVPDPPAGSVAEPTQMSGMPLQVGDLPPGIVVVRVIRRSFADNVKDQRVDLRVGPGGRTVSATTDASGRAQFNGQTIGATVSATAVVDGERLDSETFEIPAQGGVRMVLVAGVGAGTPAAVTALGSVHDTASMALPPASTAAATGGPVSSAGGPAGPVGDDDVLTFTIRRRTLTVMAGAIVAGGALLMVVGWRRRAGSEAAQRADDGGLSNHAAASQSAATTGGQVLSPAGGPDASARRAHAFQELVRLEREFAAGRVSDAEFGAQREARLNEIASIDEALALDGRRI